MTYEKSYVVLATQRIDYALNQCLDSLGESSRPRGFELDSPAGYAERLAEYSQVLQRHLDAMLEN